MMRNQKGITMIMLVITIIILLILAAISINMALGDNGIFKSSNKAKIMSKVQVLDDTIKSYTLKSTDLYSSSKKTIEDLIEEGILKEITFTEGKDDKETKKSIFYINFENPDVDIAKLLGLENGVYKNQKKLNEFTFTNLSEIQNKGIYVVDHDLNAAYLADNNTYGKLVNFGDYADNSGNLDFASQNLTLRINPKTEVAKEQEVVIVLDITPSMSYAMKNTTNRIAYDRNDRLNGYNSTRWAATVKALDTFIETYFEKSENDKKSITLYTFAGDNQSEAIKQVYRQKKSIAEAKAGYSNIFTYSHYSKIMEKVGNRDNNTNYTIGPHYTSSKPDRWYTYYETYYKSLDSNIANAPGFGGNTCAPNALYTAYEYTNSIKDEKIQRDVIILTDGESNKYWGAIRNGTTELGRVGGLIKKISSGGRNVGMYAVGVSSDISNLRKYFAGTSGRLEDNCDGIFEATEADEIADSFQTILENISKDTDVSTNTSNSHSIQYNNAGKIEDYKIMNVNRVVVELTNTKTNKTITLVFEKQASSSQNIYAVDDIYDSSTGVISLYEAWVYSGLDAASIEEYNEKVITVYTDKS